MLREDLMLGVVFVRRLREGKTYDDFREAWYPDTGFGVPARILSGTGLGDPREIVTIGFLDVDATDLEQLGANVAAAEATRHDRIDAVVESTELRTFFAIEGDHDFSDRPSPLPEDRQGFPWS
jgi:hypothetical protein